MNSVWYEGDKWQTPDQVLTETEIWQLRSDNKALQSSDISFRRAGMTAGKQTGFKTEIFFLQANVNLWEDTNFTVECAVLWF